MALEKLQAMFDAPAEDVEAERARLISTAKKAERALANLNAAIAAGEPRASLMAAIRDRERTHTSATAELKGLDSGPALRAAASEIRIEALRLLEDWRGLLGRNVQTSRQLLAKLVHQERFTLYPVGRGAVQSSAPHDYNHRMVAAAQDQFGRNPQTHRLLVLFVSVTLLTATSCDRPLRSGALIDAYRTANCVAPTFAKGVEPPTRGWDATIVIAGAAKATVQGADLVGGEVAIRYEADGREMVAVDPGDYIYPKDVRLSDAHDRLYVKASGAAAGIWDETWLYEFDLLDRKQVRKNRVHPDALPPECPMPKK